MTAHAARLVVWYRDQKPLGWAVAALTVVVAAQRWLHLGTLDFGVEAYRFGPPVWVLTAVGLQLACALTPVGDAVLAGLDTVWRRVGSVAGPRLRLALPAVALALGMYFLVSQRAFGDWHLYADRIRDGQWLTFSSPLGAGLYAAAAWVGQRLAGLRPDYVIRLVNANLCPLLLVFAVAGLARAASDEARQRRLTALLLLSPGAMAVFSLGREPTAMLAPAMVALLALVCRWERGEVRVAWLGLAAGLTSTLHGSGLFALPALAAMAVWRGWQSGRAASAVRHGAALVLAFGLPWLALKLLAWAVPGVVAVDLYRNVHGGGDGRILPPTHIDPTYYASFLHHYTLGSALHWRTWLSMNVLLGPFTLPALVLATVLAVRDRDGSPATVGLLLLSLSYLVYTFLWNPDLGMDHDWDLFAQSQWIYLAVLARQLGRRRRGPALTAPLGRAGLVAAVHTGLYLLYVATHSTSLTPSVYT